MGGVGIVSRDIQTLFDNISPTYDRVNRLLTFGIYRSWRTKTLKQISIDKEIPLKALDVCAGTLDLSIEFLKLYPSSQVTALDFSCQMLKGGLKKIPPHFKNRISVVCADAIKLPFGEEKFDVVFCAYGMRNLDDNKQGLKEIRAVLKPRGKILILDFFRPRKTATKIFHQTYSKFWLPFIGGLISGNRKAYTYLHDSVKTYYTPEEYQNLLTQSGFQVLPSRDFLWGISSVVTGTKDSRS